MWMCVPSWAEILGQGKYMNITFTYFSFQPPCSTYAAVVLLILKLSIYHDNELGLSSCHNIKNSVLILEKTESLWSSSTTGDVGGSESQASVVNHSPT